MLMSSKGLAVLCVSFVVSWAATKVLIPLLQGRGLLDVPNERSSHAVPTPRGGGIGIIFGLVAGATAAHLLGLPLPGGEFLIGALLVALIGFVDDRTGGLSVVARLALQVAASGLVIYQTGGLERLPLPHPLDVPLGALAIPAALVWIVGVTNLYNFLDGIDGFAGLQGAVVGLGLAFLGLGQVSVVGFAAAGACVGFLLHNWHPAKVFMGDVGSGTLGFLLAALPFQLDVSFRSEVVFIVAMCLWFFLSDGVFTLFRRALRGEKVWAAHRSHLYQRLVRTGLRHDQVVERVIGGAALLAVLAVVSARSGERAASWMVVVAAACGFLAYYVWLWSREKHLKQG
jgi:UDP-N-acetylmuramyl pentapeptide phosphotransferase/UDP-N-acetylglucosamine-1-phosphate transferase